MSSSLHLALACGGTGGHFFPALAIAREFRNQGGAVTFFVSGQHVAEHRRLAGEAGFPAVELSSVRLPRGAAEVALFPFRLLVARHQARRALVANKPDLLLGMGSFATVPAALAAKALRIPIVLHEGNTKTGKANRFLARFAKLLMTSFPEQADRLPCPTVHTGFPLRESLIAAANAPATPREYLLAHGLDESLPVLLVFGGSQGARFINQLLAETAATLAPEPRRRLQVLHFTGQADNRELLSAYHRAGLSAAVKSSETDMAAAYQAASLVVSRAGAATISELALFAKPAVLIPLPTAADDHQTANARCVTAQSAALLFPQDTPAPPQAMATVLETWLAKPTMFEMCGQKLRRFANPDAAARAVAELLKLGP